MEQKLPKVSVDILIERKGKILLGLLSEKWAGKGKNIWGVPGREILFGETIRQTVQRNIKEEFDCKIKKFEIFCINANYALGNHFIGIGIKAEINAEPKLLLPEDWVEWKWFSRKELPKNLFPAAKNLIECYYKKKINAME